MKRIVSFFSFISMLFSCTALSGIITLDFNDIKWNDNSNTDEVVATAIKLNKTSLVFGDYGETERLIATVEPHNTTDSIEWFSSDVPVAKVSSEGMVTSVAAGKALITARCGDVNTICNVTVEMASNIEWQGTYKRLNNPLTKFSAPDPTIIKIGSYYYLACTGFPINIYRSNDLANWKYYRSVFDGSNNDPFNTGVIDPFIMGSSNLYYWAPSFFVNGGKVYLYVYTIDAFHPRDIAATQLFEASSIDGAFIWIGTVNEDGVDTKEFRDTQFFKDTDGTIYISTGDGSSTTKRIARMSSDLITVDGHSWGIQSVDHEGTLLYKHNGWYYLFFSGGSTASYTYNVKCFRSKDINATVWENCGVLLEQTDSTEPLNSTGHVGEIMEDSDGKLYMFMHCHCYGLTQNDSVGYGKRYLYCQQIVFDNNDMPHFVDKDGNYTTIPQRQIECPNIQFAD